MCLLKEREFHNQSTESSRWPHLTRNESMERNEIDLQLLEEAYVYLTEKKYPTGCSDIREKELSGRVHGQRWRAILLVSSCAWGYSVQANGLDKCFNQTLQMMLVKFVHSKKQKWSSFLDTCVFAYNTSQHESSKFTPFQLMFGRRATLPIDQKPVELHLRRKPSSYERTEEAGPEERFMRSWRRPKQTFCRILFLSHLLVGAGCSDMFISHAEQHQDRLHPG